MSKPFFVAYHLKGGIHDQSFFIFSSTADSLHFDLWTCCSGPESEKENESEEKQNEYDAFALILALFCVGPPGLEPGTT